MRDDHYHGGENGPCVCKGVMSYSHHCRTKWQNDKTPIQWSTCSAASWTKYYVDTLAKRTHPYYVNTLGLPKWCLTPDSTNFCSKFKKINKSVVHLLIEKYNLMIRP